MYNRYIIITSVAEIVGGSLIYYRNKAKYLEEKGWKISILAVNKGKIYVKGLERYVDNYMPFLNINPSNYYTKQRSKYLDMVLDYLNIQNEKIIIETGDEFQSLWGELIAQKIGAKHITIYLGERSYGFNKEIYRFFKFKYDRKELACINQDAFWNVFGKAFHISYRDTIVLPCYCSNVIDDYDLDFTKSIIKSDFNIGYIGRLNKEAVPFIVDSICQFCKNHKNISVTAVFWGGTQNKRDLVIIREKLESYNVKCFISDYVCPLPVDGLKKCDIYSGISGSANVPVMIGIPSVRVNMFGNEIDGFIEKTEPLQIKYLSNDIQDYYEYVFKGLYLNKITPVSIEETWKKYCLGYNQHMSFVEKSTNVKDYFDVNTIKVSFIRKLKRIIKYLLFLIKCYF